MYCFLYCFFNADIGNCFALIPLLIAPVVNDDKYTYNRPLGRTKSTS